jgi:hypothetical protein
MDERTKAAVDATLETELFYNERIIQHPTFGSVRLRRATPAQDRLISEARRKQYHSDLKDDGILSRDEIEAIAIRRGMWAPQLTERITTLTRRTGEAMGILEVIGFTSIEALLDVLNSTVSELLALFGDNEEIRAVIARYGNLDETNGLEDRNAIIAAAPSTQVDDLLDKIDAQRSQIEIVEEMLGIRRELTDLQVKQARLFVDSVESRADRAEELAKVYYCCTLVETGGPLWPTYDDIWNAPAEDVEVLILQLHYFQNGVTLEMEETLEKYGFIKRLGGTKDSSEDAPDQPLPSFDGESAESEPTDSSPATE